MNAEIVLAKCQAHHYLFGIRAEELADGSWLMNWAFPLEDRRAAAEGYDSKPITAPKWAETYPGCPHCGSANIMQCGSCRAITCMPVHAVASVCAWCGTTCRIEGVITVVPGSGDR